MDSYYIGLDIGTESVGWAVTDAEYHILKRNGKALWGIRLFKEAQTAEERRKARVARRRIERTRQRIDWLQNVFAEEIGKVDPAFFQRLKESKFLEEDKLSDRPLGRYTLFNDANFCDKDYRKLYPTIYHLRKELIENPSAHDVRLVYLAVHHIMKKRGHFLFDNLSLDAVSIVRDWEDFAEFFPERKETLNSVTPEALESVLKASNTNSAQKKKQLLAMFGDSKDKQLAAIADLLTGRKAGMSDLLKTEEAYEDIEKFSMKDDFDAAEPKLAAALGDDIEIIYTAKRIYDCILLSKIRKGKAFISDSKIEDYEKHQRDLALLKKTCKQMGKTVYNKVFRESKDKLNNYTAYSGHRAEVCRCSQEDFYKFLKSELKGNNSDEAMKILAEIEAETFLPKQTTRDNAVVPHQLHQEELEAILQNASAYLPFLNEKDASGLTKKEQIVQMFAFRIPYYVGPLDSRSEHSWIVRDNVHIYPWNFEQVVDIDTTAEKFIRRMTAKCSYLGEDVLPKNSLLYSRYMVLNELNNLRINGRKISVDLKQRIYTELFMQGKKVTGRRLKEYLRSIGAIESDAVLSGFDRDFKASLSTAADFAWLTAKPNGAQMAEEIIRHITLFGEDRRLLEKWVNKAYGKVLSADERKRAMQKRYSDWGNLSEEFLTQIYHTDPETGECRNLIDGLWETNCNLMELLSSEYNYADAVEQYRAQKMGGEITLEKYLEESYASPAIKRAIHQTMRIVAEIEKIMGGTPKRVFVEVAREDGEKGKRTVSRKEKLELLYAKCREEAPELYEQLKLEDEGKLRSDKYYLYYAQLGKCMYSGERIELDGLDRYDIDHIYPQSKTKDDSIDNRVLVKRELNGLKSDVYPIPAEWRKKMRGFWELLKSKELISAKKFDRLTGTSPLTEEQLAGFISRQLVETRQSTKLIAELLNNRYADRAEVVYVKAGNVSAFRQEQRMTKDGRQMQEGECKRQGIRESLQDPLFVKCREINDFHHAKDAYLNIVVGNVYHVKFTKNPLHFIKNSKETYSLNRMFDFDVSRGGETAWKCGADGSIAVVRRTMAKNNILFTRMPVEQKGELFDLQIMKAGLGQAQIKSSNPRLTIEKFGGYNKLTGAYFCLVEHTSKKKRVRSIETVLLMHKALYERNPEQYCQEILCLENPAVLVKKIPIDSLISIDGFHMHISGRTGGSLSCKNAEQLVLAPKWNAYVKRITKYLERCAAARKELKVTSFDGLNQNDNIELYTLLLEKIKNTIYGKQFGAALKTLEAKQTDFDKASVLIQCKVLVQMLNLFACNVSPADLTDLGAGKTGFLRPSKNVGSAEIELFNQSVTGFFTQSIHLNKIQAK